jgi:endonuclease/exonuclease/phosphatase family metal-dependent hydrolase
VTACSFHTAVPEPASRKTDFLGGVNADTLILQEVDLNARRTHRLNTAETIARKLEMNYVFGREFQELVRALPGRYFPADAISRRGELNVHETHS